MKDQRKYISKLPGPVIAIKQAALLRPDAYMMLVAAKEDPSLCKPVFKKFTGDHIVSRKILDGLPSRTKFISRVKKGLSHDPRYVGGLDIGTSAINIAFHMIGGKGEIVVLGYDMTGGRWSNGELPHHLPYPPQAHFDRHLLNGAEVAQDIKKTDVKVWNASPISQAKFYEYRNLKEFL